MLITIFHTGTAADGEQFQVQWGTKRPYAPVTVQAPETEPVEGYEKLNLKTGLFWYFEEFLHRPFGADAVMAQAVEKALQAWGGKALKALFSDDAQICLYEAKQNLTAVQIRLISDAPAVLSWPWEALWDKERQYLFLHSSIERQPGDIEAESRLPAVPADSLNILLVISRPNDNDINYHFLSRDVAELVSEDDKPIRVDVLRPPTFDNLRRTLEARRGYYHIVHFDGHGGYGTGSAGPGGCFQGAEGRLLFEKYVDGNVEPDLVSAETLGQLLGGCGVPMMVLNACQSAMINEQAESPYASVAASLLRAHVRSVVAMGYSLFAGGGKAFVKAFYGELLRSGRTELAMREGRIAMYRHTGEAYPLSDWMVPQLYQQAQLGERVLPDLTGKTRAPAPSRLPEEARLDETGFVGRGRMIQELERLTALRPQGGVLIYGMMGEGKTTLVKGFLRWLEQTGGLDEDGDKPPVLWLDFRGVDTAEEAVNRMAEVFLGDDLTRPCDRDRVERLTAYLRAHPKRIVWDNFETASGMDGVAAPRLSPDGLRMLAELLRGLDRGRSKVLITSRTAEPLLESAVCVRVSAPLRGLESSEVWALCVGIAVRQGFSVRREDEDLDRLLDKLYGNPLALRSVLLRLGDMGPKRLLEAYEQALTGAEGDESTRRIRASFALLCDGMEPALHPVLQALSLFEHFTDTVMLVNMLRSLRDLSPNSPEAETLRTDVLRCLGRLEQAGFCQHVRGILYRLHPSLRPCLTERFTPDDALRRMFVCAVRATEKREHSRAQTRRGFAAVHTANCRLARELALLFGMPDEAFDLTFALAVFASDCGNRAEEEALLLALAEQAERSKEPERLRQACGALSAYYGSVGDKEQALSWAERAAASAETGEELTADGICARAELAFRRGELAQAAAEYEKAAARMEQSGDERLANVYGFLFSLSGLIKDADGVAKWRARLTEQAEACTDDATKASICRSLGVDAWENGEKENALALLQKSYDMFNAIGDREGAAVTGNMFGRRLLDAGLPEKAKPYLDEALETARALQDRRLTAASYEALGLCAAMEHKPREYALGLLRESMGLCRELGDSRGIAVAQKTIDEIEAGKYD